MAKVHQRDCLKIPDKPHCGLSRVLRTQPGTPFHRLACHQTQRLRTPLAIFQTVSEGVFSEVELPLYGVLRNSVARFCIDWSLRGAQKRFWSETLLFALFFLCTLRTIEGQCLKLSE